MDQKDFLLDFLKSYRDGLQASVKDRAHADQVALRPTLTPAPSDHNASGGDTPRSAHFWVRLCLIDGPRHTGEIQALSALWERRWAVPA